MTVCFTGHRKIPDEADVQTKLRALIARLIEDGATDFYAGGAVGFDMLAEETVLELRGEHPHIRLHIVLPCPFDEQVAKWGEQERERYGAILAAADSQEVISPTYTADCMRKRNARLVALSPLCVCFLSVNSSPRSGTKQTVRMAEDKGIEVINLCPSK